MAFSWRNDDTDSLDISEEHLKLYVNSQVKVTVASGDITLMSGDAAVVGEDTSLSGFGAVAGAFAEAGGLSYTFSKNAMKRSKALGFAGGAKSVYWCDAGRQLPYKRIYHAVNPQVFGVYDKSAWRASIAQLYTRVCAEADSANAETSLVSPILGSGVGGGGDFTDTVWGALDGIRVVYGDHLKDVTLVDIDRNKALKIASVCRDWVDDQRKVHFNMQCRLLSDAVPTLSLSLPGPF